MSGLPGRRVATPTIYHRQGLSTWPDIDGEENKATAYKLADNRLTDRSSWDDRKVAIVLKELSDIAPPGN